MEKRVNLYHKGKKGKIIIIGVLGLILLVILGSYALARSEHKITTEQPRKHTRASGKKTSVQPAKKQKVTEPASPQPSNFATGTQSDATNDDRSTDQEKLAQQAEYNREKFRKRAIDAQNATHALVTNPDGTRSYVTKAQAEQAGTMTTLWDMGPDGDVVPVYDSKEMTNQSNDDSANNEPQNNSDGNVTDDDNYEVTSGDDENTVIVKNKKTGETIQKKSVGTPDWDYVHDRPITY
ncbi:hypothetical protein M3M35_07075 [Fructilactobacillus myrtifloralis]|uniref:Uncharacterized protein n=1 Tax=Fructilactobacillus myrtifloralis TaxID=2940301 RepID=A0ABY5BRP8_9LACO|nr:hypothetical protein [Fructilactobacillus myrtifloralis]USS85044.1 hypothetical protein M3M35_07075 [Fructilactobacillus myrtifloralis]